MAERPATVYALLRQKRRVQIDIDHTCGLENLYSRSDASAKTIGPYAMQSQLLDALWRDLDGKCYATRNRITGVFHDIREDSGDTMQDA